jgi:hypothetical protein
LFLIAFPLIVQADVFDTIKNGLVPCGTTANPKMCTVCDLFKLLQNIINFMLYVAAPLATLAAVYIGILFLISGGNPKLITMARTNLWYLVLGIFWVLGSWLVLNTIINFAVDPGVFKLPWNQIDCSVSAPSTQTQAQTQTTETPPAQPVLPKQTLSEQEAKGRLQQAGITVNKNPCPAGVNYQNVSGGCTSLEGVKTATIDAVIELKRACNCAVEVTGGTELGHETGVLSHANGYKLDLNPNTQLDNYIKEVANYIGNRDDGAPQYRAPNGTLYAKEGNHWDIVFVR